MNKAITLVELVIAISLMSVVILGATTFDTSSRKFLGSSERRAAVLNELNLVLDYMQKDAANCTWSFNSTVVGGDNWLRMNQDLTNSPGNPGTGNVTYVFGVANANILKRCDNTGACVILSRRFVAPNYTLSNPYQAIFNSPTVRYDPTRAVDNSTNPQVTSGSIYFYPSEGGRS